MTHSTKITCPNCNSELDVEEVLGDRIEKQYKQQYQADVAKLTSEYKQKESALAQKEAVLKEQAAEVDKLVIENTQKAIARKEKEILKEAEERAKSHFAVQLKTQSEETAELKKQLQESQAAQLENARLKREMEKQKHATALELQNKLAENEEQIRKSFDERLKAEKESITKQEMERNEKQVAELQKQLTDAKKAAEDAVRKAEQGSQQLQGEVQELMIEEFLTLTFPSDEIGEVKKGVSGADVKQIVRNRIGIESGVILYESKNTQSFQKDWIEKLKTDAEQEKADIAVLVTKTMPKGMEHLGLINGVWVCSVSEFKGLVLALRDNMIKLNEVRMAQTNKGDKMQMLYDYLTDGKFAEQIQRVVLGFKELQEGYEKEKKSQQKIWKKRDEQLEMMFRNTTDFVTQIQVIAGSTLPQLESPEDELLALGAEQE